MISPGSAIPAGPDDGRAGAGEVPDAGGGRPGSGPAQVTAGLPAGMIAVRAADVARPGGTAGSGALLAAPASAGPGASGEMLVFTCPGAGAPPVGRRGGGGGARGLPPPPGPLWCPEPPPGPPAVSHLVQAPVA